MNTPVRVQAVAVLRLCTDWQVLSAHNAAKLLISTIYHAVTVLFLLVLYFAVAVCFATHGRITSSDGCMAWRRRRAVAAAAAAAAAVAHWYSDMLSSTGVVFVIRPFTTQPCMRAFILFCRLCLCQCKGLATRQLLKRAYGCSCGDCKMMNALECLQE